MPNRAFMSNLPDWVSDDEIESWLNAAGILFDRVQVARDFETQASKGHALIDAATEEDLVALVKRFHRAPIQGKVLRVRKAQAETG